MSVFLRPVLKYVSLALSFALVLGTLFTVSLHLEVFVGADETKLLSDLAVWIAEGGEARQPLLELGHEGLSIFPLASWTYHQS